MCVPREINLFKNDLDFKGIPGCFFTRTFLLKISKNLEPICNNVNIKCS